jgi:hypothetical protein
MLQDKKTWLKGKLKDPETKQPLADPNGDEEKISQKIVNLLDFWHAVATRLAICPPLLLH